MSLQTLNVDNHFILEELEIMCIQNMNFNKIQMFFNCPLMLFSIRASRWRRGGFERWDVSHRYDGGHRLSAGLQTEATQSVSAGTHSFALFDDTLTTPQPH